MVADFGAFENYLEAGFDKNTIRLSIKKNAPASHPLFGFELPPEYQKQNYLMIDMAGSALGASFREVLVQNLLRQGQQTPSAIKGVPLAGVFPNKIDEIRKLVNDAGQHPTLKGMGGGVSDLISSVVLVDSRTIKSIGKEIMPDATERDLSLFQNFVRHHEAAHLMLGMKEPGSDFVAAALSLRENPDSRGMVRQWADWRIIAGMYAGGENADQYGTECHDAIERAMSIPPERLRSMSVKELYGIGASYDRENARNSALKHSPEDAVRDSIAGWDVGRGLKFLWDKATSLSLPGLDEIGTHFQTETVSIQDMRDNLPDQAFARGSKESAIAENLREALGRSRTRDISIIMGR